MDNYLERIKYEKIGESENAEEKQLNWNIAFGLQAVDNLTPSKYMVKLAEENILGKKSYNQVKDEINEYYNVDNNELYT